MLIYYFNDLDMTHTGTTVPKTNITLTYHTYVLKEIVNKIKTGYQSIILNTRF